MYEYDLTNSQNNILWFILKKLFHVLLKVFEETKFSGSTHLLFREMKAKGFYVQLNREADKTLLYLPPGM